MTNMSNTWKHTHLEIQKIIKPSLQCLSLNDFSQEKWLCHIKNRKLYSRKKGEKETDRSAGIMPPLKTYVWVSKMKQRGNRKPLFTQFILQESWVWNPCLAARDAFHRLYSYSECWHCGLYFWLSGTCVRRAQTFFLSRARLVLWWFAMNFTVQKCVRSNQVAQCNFGVNLTGIRAFITRNGSVTVIFLTLIIFVNLCWHLTQRRAAYTPFSNSF